MSAVSPKFTDDQELQYNFSAEQSVLGCLLLEYQTWDEISDRLVEHDFFLKEHQIVFRAISELSNKSQAFDMVVVNEYLSSKNLLENIGGEGYLYEVANNTASVANIQLYARIVRDKAILRELVATARRIADLVYKPEGQTVEELISKADAEMFSFITKHEIPCQRNTDAHTALAHLISQMEVRSNSPGKLPGLSYGFPSLDALTLGFTPSQLVILAARPSMGKTTFALNIAFNASINLGMPVLLLSLEMPSSELLLKIFGTYGNIELSSIQKGILSKTEWKNIFNVFKSTHEKPLFIEEPPRLSINDLRTRVRRFVREQGRGGLIIIDYLQLMSIPGYKPNHRVSEISEISRGLKSIARECEVPILALSQLNRALEGRGNKRPMMSDLRESGSIEQDADLVLFIYRDEVYNENSPDKGLAEIVVSKNRNGQTGTVKLAFKSQFGRFEEVCT